jgi:tRNA(Ile)-lysidine synthase
MDIVERVRDTIERHGLLPGGERVVVGVSGGPDSLALLHILRRLAPDYRVALHVGHLEHGIRGEESRADAAFVRATAEDWGLPVTVAERDVPAIARDRGLAIEEAARQERYRFLGDLARSRGARTVAVAHHADDQVETVLMHLLRGAGLAGLRGMRPLARLDALRLGDEATPPAAGGGIRLVRPLLYVERAAIEAYCAAEGLTPRYDRSNLDTTYYRNRLRHELIPHLETFNPNVRAVLRRTAEALAGDYQVLRGILAEVWPRVVASASEEWIVFRLDALQRLPDGLLRSVLREGIHRLRRSLRNVSWAHVDDALALVRGGRTGAAATLPAGLILRLGYDRALLAHENAPWPPSDDAPRLAREPLLVQVPGRTALGGGWVLDADLVARDALPWDWDRAPHPLTAYLDADRLAETPILRTRRAGDRLTPLGLEGRRQRLTDLMINEKIPREERDAVPLLVSGEEIAWVVGLRVGARFAVGPETRRIVRLRVRREKE